MESYKMKEKLIIKNFAGIKSLELELGRINIFIGPQATGKSVAAKLLYFFKSFPGEIYNTIIDENSKPEMDARIRYIFNRYFPLPDRKTDSPFKIRYELGKEFIQINNAKPNTAKFELLYSDNYKKLLRDCRAKYKDPATYTNQPFLKPNPIRSFGKNANFKQLFNHELYKVFKAPAHYDQIFIPSGRSFFSTFQGSLFSILSSNKAIDPFITEFGSIYEKSGSTYDPRIELLSPSHSPLERTALKKVPSMIKQILSGGEYFTDKGKEYLSHNDGRIVSIASASSGQQETLPLLKVLFFVFRERFLFTPNFSVYIEEPETHIFPTTQKHIVELTSIIYNVPESPIQYIITTHSPYILTAFNNLIQAGILKETLPEAELKKLYKIVPEEQALSPDDVNAYVFDGKSATNLMSPETGLITSDIIDEVSNELSIQFGELLELEP
jgi:AAA ATPase domain